MSRSCPCGGSNENCFLCWGTGGVLSPGKPKRSENLRLSVNRSPAARALATRAYNCPYCTNPYYKQSLLDDHIDQVHVADQGDESFGALRKPLIRLDGRIVRRRATQKAATHSQVSKSTAKRGTRGFNQASEVKTLIACGKCKSWVREDRLARHYQKVHGAILRTVAQGISESKQVSNNAATPPPLTASPSHRRVGLASEQIKLEDHGRPQDDSGPPRVCSNPDPQAPARRQLVPCGKCGSQVRQDRLERHVQRLHGEAPIKGRVPKAVGPKGKRQTQAANADKGKPLDYEATSNRGEYWEERRLDGSRDYWGYREQGMFGSYPSFDDCEDESRP
jgi:hypothetical protein